MLGCSLHEGGGREDCLLHLLSNRKVSNKIRRAEAAVWDEVLCDRPSTQETLVPGHNGVDCFAFEHTISLDGKTAQAEPAVAVIGSPFATYSIADCVKPAGVHRGFCHGARCSTSLPATFTKL